MPPLLVKDLSALWTGDRVLRDVSILMVGGKVVELGSVAVPSGAVVIDGGGKVGVPGLVDAHTHLVHAGTRLGDFVKRLSGTSYTEILEGGGGIHTTVAATRAASEESLAGLCRARLRAMLERGVTTVASKSGYGLDVATEVRMLRAARAAAWPIDVSTTFLGAHAVPPGCDRGQYIDEVCGPMLTACAPLCEALDVYCDRGAFTLDEAVRILAAGKARGLALRVHAEQVAHTGVAAVAARMGALSCDHLEQLDDEGVAAMAEHNTIAMLLPGAMVYLRDPPPPVAKLRAAGVHMAVATDFNPGSSPVADLWTCATLACLTMGLSPEEALAGITWNAARALGRTGKGWIGPGSAADLALFAPPPGEIADPRVLVQHMGGHRAEMVFIAGRRAC